MNIGELSRSSLTNYQPFFRTTWLPKASIKNSTKAALYVLHDRHNGQLLFAFISCSKRHFKQNKWSQLTINGSVIFSRQIQRSSSCNLRLYCLKFFIGKIVDDLAFFWLISSIWANNDLHVDLCSFFQSFKEHSLEQL